MNTYSQNGRCLYIVYINVNGQFTGCSAKNWEFYKSARMGRVGEMLTNYQICNILKLPEQKDQDSKIAKEFKCVRSSLI